MKKIVVILAAVLIGLSGCSKVNTSVIRVSNEPSGMAKHFPIAVFPVYNLSGMRAPLKEIQQSFINILKRQGFSSLDNDELEKVLARHRIRYVGGITEVTAKTLKKEAGAETVLITYLENYSEMYPPKIALTSRLVSTDGTTKTLWMDDIGLAGDDSPGILGLGLIDNPRTLLKIAIQHLTTSLSEFLSGQNYSMESSKNRNKFWPKVIYRSPILASDLKYRVAVLPFFNLSERKYADEIIALHFLRRFRTYDNFDIIEPGVVRNALLGLRIVMEDGLSFADSDVIFSRLDADLILTGKIIDYQDYRGQYGKAKVDFSALLIERKSREVVWSSKSSNNGDDGVFFFDFGKVNTAHAMASEMVGNVVELITEENP